MQNQFQLLGILGLCHTRLYCLTSDPLGWNLSQSPQDEYCSYPSPLPSLSLYGMLVNHYLHLAFCQLSLTVCWYLFIALVGERHSKDVVWRVLRVPVTFPL